MKYDVKFSCGHTHTVEIFGSGKDRERKIEWYENEGLCPDCYKTQQQAIRQAEKEKEEAELKENFSSLPEIQGVSEKQIAYATNLRRKFLNSDDGKTCRKMYAQIGNEYNGEKITLEWIENKLKNDRKNHLYHIRIYHNLITTMTNAREIIDAITKK